MTVFVKVAKNQIAAQKTIF